ncbi:MAG: hypothetical protein HQ461_04230 [Deltaproteobacteria bacterium]|nr:hypothetical protein [Deltaproteobacteria bacterium]
MKRNEDEAMTAAQLRQLRDGWQPAGELPADYAAQVVAVAVKRRRRRMGLSVLLALVAVLPVVWQLRQAPEVVAETSMPEATPMVAAEAVAEAPALGSATGAEGGLLPQPVAETGTAAPMVEVAPDLVAEAVVLRPERALKSRRSYRDSFRELGEEYDGLADIYFDDAAR